MPNLRKGTSMLSRRANEVKMYRIMRRVIPIAMGGVAVFLTLVYVIALMYTRYGSFTVSVNKYHQLQYGLSLCEKRDFSSPTSRLECNAKEEITNIDGATLDRLNLGVIDGNDSGDNYLCYTFYCKNVGKETVSFEYAMNIGNMTMDIEKAVRIRVITNRNGENGTKTDYARAKGVDENGNSIPEKNTVPFYDKNTVFREHVYDFTPGEICKYTVVIWLEGPDEDCVDAVIGGEFEVDMKFSVTSVSDVELEPETKNDSTLPESKRIPVFSVIPA